ncbi:PREDICTED: eukaryotic translation initiation factor 5B-like [Nicotiana attenuata]|uniref:eukaryotic translation initiation factor 5B-like n=1 Tax=Nicotiana attenuata TaxID=49451 RepID=UPI000904B03F|nr:PREDICTED: eukaryotic translation initiation factor 5B-like [Nicotiana attenuata]
MENLSENPKNTEYPSSPPKERSTTQTPKKKYVNMLSQKIESSREHAKKLNEKLKASQAEETQKSAEPFKSTSEEEEHVSSEAKQGDESANRGKSVEIGSSGSRDTTTAERLASLRKRFQEPIPSRKEPLHDLLQKVFYSYNPKKKQSTRVKIPGKEMGGKMRKDSSSIPVETPPTRGRTTRSQKKQSEANLKKALAESGKKVVAKGKKKVEETSEAISIKEMDLVLHDEDAVEEVEVATPSAKKRKTSKKKSPKKSIDTEESALSKRTKSAKKSRKVQIVEEESEEEETDEEMISW